MPTLTFRVSPAEARFIRAKARAEKSTVSAFHNPRVFGGLIGTRKARGFISEPEIHQITPPELYRRGVPLITVA